MTKPLATFAVATTVAVGAVLYPTTAGARWWHHPWWHHHGFLVAPIILAPPPPIYFGPQCNIRLERIWDGWVWRVRRLEECY